MAHWKACKRILRYLAGTMDYGIKYSAASLKAFGKSMMPQGYFDSRCPDEVAEQTLNVYVDADFANALDDRHSVTGYLFLMAGGPISWQSRSQPTVALSSMESEYMAATAATQECLWLKYILEELDLGVALPITLFEDNKACIAFSENPGNFRRTKHIDYRHHFVREAVQRGDIKLVHIPTTYS